MASQRENLQSRFEEAMESIWRLCEPLEHYEIIAKNLFPRTMQEMSATEILETARVILRDFGGLEEN